MLGKDDMALRPPPALGLCLIDSISFPRWYASLNTAGLPLQKALRVVKVHLWGPAPLTRGSFWDALSNQHGEKGFSVHNFWSILPAPLIFFLPCWATLAFQYSIYVSRARKLECCLQRELHRRGGLCEEGGLGVCAFWTQSGSGQIVPVLWLCTSCSRHVVWFVNFVFKYIRKHTASNARCWAQQKELLTSWLP